MQEFTKYMDDKKTKDEVKETLVEKPSSFTKEVAKYFMNFLETDFKKRRIPKRNSIQKSLNGLMVGLDIDKYPKFKRVIFDNLNKGFKKERIEIKKGEYTKNIPKTLFSLIESKIEKIQPKLLNEVFKEVEEIAEDYTLMYAKEYDKFLENITEKTKSVFSQKFVSPFLEDLDKPLENLDLADENSKYQLELDIRESLFATFENKYLEIMQTYFQKNRAYNLQKALKEAIKLSELKYNLTEFFHSFVVGDIFFEIYQLYRNNKLIDKTEIYLYFYEISLGNEKFPLLYIPITVQKEENKFVFNFEKRLFVNTKAIDFVVQEFNTQVLKKATLAGEFDRIIYINGEENFFSVLENIIKKIENFFELNKNIEVQNSEYQKSVNLITSLSNKSYIYLFDKSDEALINDYEEILNDDGDVIKNFTELLNSFIEENPVAFMTEVRDEWDEKSVPDKLVMESPIPLNDEQKQVLMALDKPDCKFLILEGPPGTGKSHTITSVICKALLEEQSVLVLSDKKEALDVVEDKISQTLNKIRREDHFQNPILRLGKTGNKFYKIVQGQTINKIREHYFAYRHKKDEHDELRKNTVENLEKNIKDNINYFTGINLQDVDYYFSNLNKFENTEWLESKDIYDGIENDLLKIKQICGRIQKNYKNNSLRINSVNNENLENLKQISEKLQKIKEINSDLEIFKQMTERFEDCLKIDNKQKNELFEKFNKLQQSFTELKPLTKDFKNKKINSLLLSENDLEKVESNINGLLSLNEVLEPSINFISGHKRITADYLQQLLPKENSRIDDVLLSLERFIQNIQKLKLPIIGYLGKRNKIFELTRELKKHFVYFNVEKPENEIKKIIEVYDLFNFVYSKIESNVNKNDLFEEIINLLVVLQKQDILEKYNTVLSSVKSIKEQINSIPFKHVLIKEIDKFFLFLQILIQFEDANSLISKVNNIKIEIITAKDLVDNLLDSRILENQKTIDLLEKALEIGEDISFIVNYQNNNKILSEKINIETTNKKINEIDSILSNYDKDFIVEYVNFIKTTDKLDKQFNQQPQDNFFHLIHEVEDLVTAQMTYFLDKRIIEYTQDFAGEVQTLKKIISKKEKFPKALFANLKKAFPCILAGIRDYAEYIPLEKDLFDLIIIDEASQVSIAQALPALVRGKKIIVLGDDKQFSNVKANNASKVTNQELRKKVQEAFIEEKIKDGDPQGWFIKVKENFDIKNSILKFLRFIRNYECQLKKHFRCYPEIISYSDKFFYNNTLECMKIRGKDINDVIKIDVIDHDGKFDETKNTNEMEVDYIINKLKEFKEKNIKQSLGIITPHREQVTLLFDKISNLKEKDWLFNECKLKIMTFDTCQGEERDYIFYSMVATKEKDRLNWIFLKDFSTLDDEIDGTIKSQRLNVGFSRAKECIHFVLSKPIEDFQGELKNALMHYQNELENAKKRISKKLDSQMEYKIDEIFHQTKFYKDNKENIEFIPQFPIGEYLRQINKNYNHPNYKVDFLLIFEGQKIIIEYDGFKEHFVNLDEVNESNYSYYMKEDDIYRQKVLEGYGYKFIRINRFNIGKNPIETLNERLEDVVKKNSKIES